MLISLSDGLGNCTNAPVFKIPRENTHFEIQGLFVRVVPASNFEPIYGVGEISWEPYMVVERNKTLALANGRPFPSGQAVCQIPTGVDIFNPKYDPAYESAPGEACPGSDILLGIPVTGIPCGSLLQTWQPKDFDCYTERYNHTIQGVQVETVAVHSWLAGRPGTFAFKTYYQLAEEDFSYTVPRAVFAKYSTVSFTKGSMKMSYTLSDVPWLYNNSAPGIVYENDRDSASFLSLFYKMSVNSSLSGKLISESHGNYSITRFASDDHTVDLSLKLDLITVLDNITSPSPGPGGGNNTLRVELPIEANVGFSGIAVILFCPTNQGHWALMEYDPSISALFSPGPEEPDSKTPGKSKSRLSQGAIAGISVGAVLVVLILVAVFALLSTRNEAFKRFVRPFTARKQAAKAKNLSPKDDPHQPLQASTPTETKWASPTKPAPI